MAYSTPKEKADHKLDVASLHQTHDRAVVLGLLEKGVNINAKDKYGKTCLFVRRSPDLVQLLIDRGASLDIADKKGNNALLWLMENEDAAQLFDVLIDAGTDIRTENNDGVTALHLCSNAPQARTLLTKGALTSATDKTGSTPLHRIVQLDQGHHILDMVSLLLDAGADINARDQFGRTPLHNYLEATCQREIHKQTSPLSLEVVSLFLKRGADGNSRDKDGNIPLHFLKSKDGSTHQKIAHCLVVMVKYDVNLNAKNLKGLTAIESLPLPVVQKYKAMAEKLVINKSLRAHLKENPASPTPRRLSKM